MLIRLGSIPTVVVSSPESAREVLKTHDLDCCSRPRLVGVGCLSYDYLDMAFVEYGDYWRELRKLYVLELYSAKRVQSFRYVREEEVGSMIESIAMSAKSRTPVNISEKFMTLTANITCRVAFGKAIQETEFKEGSFMNMIHEAVAMLESFSASDFFPRFGWIVDRFTGLHSRLEKSFRNLDVFYQKVIEEHRNATKSHEQEDMVDLLLKMVRDQTELAYGVDLLSRIQVNAWGIGLEPSLRECPKEFVPERFEDRTIDYRGNHFELLPFGAGQRGCPGMLMAMAMIELALVNVLHSFDWELPEGMTEGDVSMEEGAGLVVSNKVPL
ncbi:hypothetical protein EUGRSUZ_B03263 [Eucalyptus grandis]|uniref:Uncharacterized protein n=2 Tax=Eucalyptus grandis TaxID=71139 RepID=A0ACC3LX27_EUCGR|nr:hypothetical protein EUGRSUZ_B03263 [Eucalyptus grandis]